MSDISQEFNVDNLIDLSTHFNQNHNTIEALLGLILKELKDRKDEGKAIYDNGILLTSEFTIIDTQIAPGHPVKGFSVKNTGTTDIYFAHNITKQPQIDADIVDVLKANPIFSRMIPNEVEHVHYNNDCIKSVHLLAVTGSPTYKIKLVW
jgi:hypothetical protein